MPALLELASRFVPTLIARRLAAQAAPLTTPQSDSFPAAIFFADISGFTHLAEHLAMRGSSGVEDLSLTLNAYFGKLIDLMLAHGGDVVKFAGDALLAVWPALDEDLAAVTRRAALAGLEVQRQFQDYAAAEYIRLSMRIGVGAGQVTGLHVGGVLGRWEFLLAGQTLIQVDQANHLARPGQVVLSPEAWALVEDAFDGARVETLAGEPARGFLVKAVRGEAWPPRLPAMTPLMPEMEPALKGYLPGAVLARLAAGQAHWLAELRQITVLFINLVGLDHTAAGVLDLAQTVVQALQTTLYRYEGSLRQFIVDDKGVTLIAILGLPPLAHEDDGLRGVRAALEMVADLQRLKLGGAIGVTTGKAYCGIIGNERRCEYAAIGQVVNLSARLMQAAGCGAGSTPWAILCDEPTYQAAQVRIAFETLAPIGIKGYTDKVAVYRPVDLKRLADRPRGEAAPLVGRAGERKQLIEALQAVVEERATRVVMVEGEAGMGKSRLALDLLGQAEALGLPVFYGAGDAVEQSTPYYPWRQILSGMLGLKEATSPSARQARLWDWLAKLTSDQAQLAALLNPILLVNFPDNHLTAQMFGQMRAANAQELLVRLMLEAAGHLPMVVMLEDAHRLDPASWALAALVSRRVGPLLLLTAYRPPGAGWEVKTALPAGYQQLRDAPETLCLRLKELSADETVALVCQRLGAARLHPAVAEIILMRAEGHPLFAEELACAWRDTGFIQVVGDECRPAATREKTVRFSQSLNGAIISRIDRLTPAEQLTLKVASVIGRAFDFQLLCEVYPLERDRAGLGDYLNHLETLGLITRILPGASVGYGFKHAVTYEVVYNLMTHAQRQELHQAVAQWYERNHPEDFYAGVLAHHWAKAGNNPKAIDYLEKAGSYALRNGAYQEGVDSLSEAVRLDDEAPGAAARRDALRRARWERKLAEAYWRLGKLDLSLAHGREALARLGRPEPATRTSLLASFALQVLFQTLRRLRLGELARRLPKLPGALPASALQDEARAWAQMGQVYYFYNRSLHSFHTVVRALNAAESAGPESGELARAYANVGLSFSILPVAAAGRLYQRSARTMAEKVNDLPSLSYVLLIIGMTETPAARWDKAAEALEAAQRLCERLGDQSALGEVLTNLGDAAYYRGDIAAVQKHGLELCRLSSQSGHRQQQAWGNSLLGMHALQAGPIDQAVNFLEQAWNLLTLDDEQDHVSGYLNRGVVAMAYTRQGDLASAQRVTETLARLTSQPVSLAFPTFDGYAGLAEASLALWEAEGEAGKADRKQRTEQACLALEHFARLFPMARPRARLWRGKFHWLAGHRLAAWLDWRRSLGLAQKLAMPYEQGLTHYEIGRCTPGRERQKHLARAAELFEMLGARYDLERAREAQ